MGRSRPKGPAHPWVNQVPLPTSIVVGYPQRSRSEAPGYPRFDTLVDTFAGGNSPPPAVNGGRTGGKSEYKRPPATIRGHPEPKLEIRRAMVRGKNYSWTASSGVEE